MIDHGRRPVLGVNIDAVDYDAAVERVMRAAAERRSMLATCSAVHGVMVGALDPSHRRRLNSFDMIVPDGQPVRWALRWRHGVPLADRVRGVDFMLALCRRAEADGIPVFLYGSTAEILGRLVPSLRRGFPRLRITGARPSAFRTVSEKEQLAIAAEIRESGAGLVFAGLGCPRQEIWAYENAELLPMPIVGIGSAFDSNAGVLPPPPEWMKRSGLEWVFRLRRDPRRLWKRYLVLNPLYLLLLAGELAGVARFGSGSESRPKRVGVA